MSDDFEKSFSDFLDSCEYDQAEEALFSMVRIAYIAGWKAAGGDATQSPKTLELFCNEQINSQHN